MKKRSIGSAALAALLLGTVLSGCTCKTRQKYDCDDAKSSRSVSKPYTGETEGVR